MWHASQRHKPQSVSRPHHITCTSIHAPPSRLHGLNTTFPRTSRYQAPTTCLGIRPHPPEPNGHAALNCEDCANLHPDANDPCHVQWNLPGTSLLFHACIPAGSAPCQRLFSMPNSKRAISPGSSCSVKHSNVSMTHAAKLPPIMPHCQSNHTSPGNYLHPAMLMQWIQHQPHAANLCMPALCFSVLARPYQRNKNQFLHHNGSCSCCCAHCALHTRPRLWADAHATDLPEQPTMTHPADAAKWAGLHRHLPASTACPAQTIQRDMPLPFPGDCTHNHTTPAPNHIYPALIP